MPVNYQMDVINPFQAALQGYGAGAQMLQQERQVGQENQLFQAQMAETQARAAKVQQETAAAEERNTVYGEFYDAVENGKLTPALVAKVTALDDKLGTFGADAMAKLTADQKKASFGNLMAPATALATGDVEAAKTNLQTQYDAMVNAGDDQGATAVKGYLDQLGTKDGQTFVQAALLRGASMMDAEGFKAQLENITALKGEKETEAVRTARTYAASFGAPGSPEYVQAFRAKLLPPPAPGTVVNVGATGKPLTPGQEAVDKKFADTYAEWVTGGGADAAKQIGQLSEAVKTLQDNKEITGPLVGMLPDGVAAFAAPELLALKESIQEVVQRNLRAVLGSQFTAPEAQQLISRAFNPSLGVPENTKRVRRLLEQMQRANTAMQGSVDYFEKNGTLQGYQYKFPTKAEFEAAADGKGPAPAAGIDFGKMDNTTLLRQDIGKMTAEQRRALSAELDRRGL